MYLTTPQNHGFALDVRTGRPLWRYERSLPEKMSLCCGPQNRGFGILGDRLFMATLDAHVVALDTKTGHLIWDVAAADADKGYSFTVAPLVVNNKVIVGVAGGEYGVRGFIDATPRTPASVRGASIRSRAPTSPVVKPGRAIRGSAADRPHR